MIHASDWVLQIDDTLRVQETAFQDVEISKFPGGGPPDPHQQKGQAPSRTFPGTKPCGLARCGAHVSPPEIIISPSVRELNEGSQCIHYSTWFTTKIDANDVTNWS